MDLLLLIKGREKKGDESLKSITKSTDWPFELLGLIVKNLKQKISDDMQF